MKPADAEEYTQALGQVVAGGWRQIALAQTLGVPKALKLSVKEWVEQRLGGYVRLSIEEHRAAIRELADQGFKQQQIAEVIGVHQSTVSRNARASDPTLKPQQNGDSPNARASGDPVETWAAMAADNQIRQQITTEAKRADRRAARAGNRAALAAAAQTITADVDQWTRHEPFTATADGLADGSVALVFTDPPYHDDTIDLYVDLGRVAARVLQDGGSLITYTSHHRLPDVVRMIQLAGLTFFWPLAMVHTGTKARMTEYGIVVHWKPLLWFVKGRFRSRDDMRFVNDLIESVPQKDAHPWQQSTVEAQYFIEALTQPGDLVFDPFCGGGTTAVAAATLRRRWLTCDTDEESVWIARSRVREVVA